MGGFLFYRIAGTVGSEMKKKKPQQEHNGGFLEDIQPATTEVRRQSDYKTTMGTVQARAYTCIQIINIQKIFLFLFNFLLHLVNMRVI